MPTTPLRVPAWLPSLKWVVPVAVCLLLAPLVWRTISHDQLRDFVQEWASARNYATGRPIYQNQEISLFHHLGVSRQPDDVFLEYNAHPPTSVLVVLPFGWMDYRWALLLWNGLSLAALFLSVVLVFWELQIPLSSNRLGLIATAIVVAAVATPLREQLLQGQWNLFLLLLFTGIWLAARRDHPWLAGGLLGLAAAIKLFPAFLLFFFLARKQWRTVVAAGLAGVGLTLLTMAILGTETYRQYFVEVLPTLSSFRSWWPGVSFNNFWSRLFDPSPTSCGITISLTNNPLLARLLTLGCSGVVVGLLGWVLLRAWKPASLDHGFALSMIAMVLVSPIAWDHYLVFLLLPAMLFWHHSDSAPSPVRWLFVLTLIPLVLHRYFFWGLLVCDPRLNWTRMVAQPWQALTALALPTYALLAWFLLGVWTAQAPKVGDRPAF